MKPRGHVNSVVAKSCHRITTAPSIESQAPGFDSPFSLFPPVQFRCLSLSLIARAEGLQVAVVSSNGVVELRKVQVDRDFGQTVEIIGGVTPADRVITNPSDSLVSGIKVHIQPSSNTVAAK